MYSRVSESLVQSRESVAEGVAGMGLWQVADDGFLQASVLDFRRVSKSAGRVGEELLATNSWYKKRAVTEGSTDRLVGGSGHRE